MWVHDGGGGGSRGGGGFHCGFAIVAMDFYCGSGFMVVVEGCRGGRGGFH